MAREGSSSHRRTGSSSSVSKRAKDDKVGPASRRSRDRKTPKIPHTVNVADKHKTNNKSSVVSTSKTVKVTPAKVVATRVTYLKARPQGSVENKVEVEQWEKQRLENMGFILSNVLEKNERNVKYRAHYIVEKDGCLLREKHNLWCKVVNEADSESIQDLKSRELKMLSQLKHPNLAALHCLLKFNEKLYLFTTGGMYGSVMDFLANYGPLMEDHGRIWFRQIVNGLDFLHYSNIAHNDLNCETLLVGNRYNILIGDLSKASYLETRALSNFVNKSLYSAPEVLLGDEYNPKLAEMWSLGVILYAFYMGHPPFRFYGSEDEQLAQLVVDQIKQLWLRKKGVPRKLSPRAWHIICSLLEPNVLRRAQMRHLKKSDFYIMRECVCGQGSYRFMCQEILGSLPDLYTSAKAVPKWMSESKTNKVVCPALRQFFTSKKEPPLRIEDAGPTPPPPPIQQEIVINLEDPV